MSEGGDMSQLAGAERNLFRSLSGAPLIQEDVDAEASKAYLVKYLLCCMYSR